RLGLTDDEPDVVLGGGLMRAVSHRTIESIGDGVRKVAPRARVTVAAVAPIVGATLLGLDELGMNSAAATRAATELSAAFAVIEGDGSRLTPRATAPPPGHKPATGRHG